MGDVKLLTGLTMMLSWFTILGGALLMPISMVLGIVVAAVLVLTKGVKQVPLGPTLLVTFATIAALTIR
jgi:hypothetical protein